MKRTFLIPLLILVVALAMIYTFGWVRLWSAQVESDGSIAKSARVYRNRGGDILIDLRTISGEIYVVRGQTVGIPNSSSLFESPPMVFSKQRRLLLVDIRSEKAGAVDPKLVHGDQIVQFVAQENKLVTIRFR